MQVLERVQSVCPVCHKILSAAYVERDGKVFFEKTCEEHGEVSVPVADDLMEYIAWTGRQVVNIPPPVYREKRADGICTMPSTEHTGKGQGKRCPMDCGPCEHHMQTACCVLIDVTQSCNQRCPYCFARAGEGDPNEPDLTELERKFDLLLAMGEKEYPYNIQISGGEPTVRDDLPAIIKLAKEKGFPYIQLNTNGRRLGEEENYAKLLKWAGVSAVFLQFDGVTDEVYEKLRGEPLLDIKMRAIENCRRAGLAVTLVPTVVRDVNLHQVGDLIRFLLSHVDVVKGIHFQPVSYFGRHPGKESRVTMFDVLHAIEEQTTEFHAKDFCPITTGHTLCCFYSTYLKEADGIHCMVSEETKQQGVGCCEACGQPDPIEIIKKDRGYVLNKWNMGAAPEETACCCGAESAPEAPVSCCGNEATPEAASACCEDEAVQEPASACCSSDTVMDMDEFIEYYRKNTFTLTGMAFMDGSNMDAERLKRCRVVQLTDDDRLVPFCAYNGLWRKAGEKDA